MFYDLIKRLIDIIMSILLLIFFSPLLILSAIAIKLDSEGPIFYTPKRVGKNGKLFKMYKFRSMMENAEEVLKNDKELLKEYKRNSYKLFNDPRITKVGKILRKFSIDEMPQFWNVFKGEMSIVGPRAYLPNELEEQQEVYSHTKPFVQTILTVKPGITGYWQVSGRSDINFDKRIEMDAIYAKKRSLSEDIKIILMTPYAMITGRGAV